MRNATTRSALYGVHTSARAATDWYRESPARFIGYCWRTQVFTVDRNQASLIVTFPARVFRADADSAGNWKSSLTCRSVLTYRSWANSLRGMSVMVTRGRRGVPRTQPMTATPVSARSRAVDLPLGSARTIPGFDLKVASQDRVSRLLMRSAGLLTHSHR